MLDVMKLMKAPYYYRETYPNPYYIYVTEPATGVVYVVNNFISGHVRMRGKGDGRYPYNYLEMIDTLFGPEKNTIEVCSGSVKGVRDSDSDDISCTVDINPEYNPDITDNGEILTRVSDNHFNRWRCDPPYNEKTARKMYGTDLPSTFKLLTAGARVCKPGAFMFLLLGPQNYQRCPKGVKRIGFIAITIVPNNELRTLNIFYKLDDKQTKLEQYIPNIYEVLV